MRKLYVRGFFLLLAAVMLISASACGGKESGVYDLNDHAFTLSQLSGKDAAPAGNFPRRGERGEKIRRSLLFPLV